MFCQVVYEKRDKLRGLLSQTWVAPIGSGTAPWKDWEGCWPGLCTSQHRSFFSVGGREAQRAGKASFRATRVLFSPTVEGEPRRAGSQS